MTRERLERFRVEKRRDKKFPWAIWDGAHVCAVASTQKTAYSCVAGLRTRAGGALMEHGVNCYKKPHEGEGYMHDEAYDGPYQVDGVTHCGRCHRAV